MSYTKSPNIITTLRVIEPETYLSPKNVPAKLLQKFCEKCSIHWTQGLPVPFQNVESNIKQQTMFLSQPTKILK
jgi:hypothetical protein